jgi:sirohydrochlorin cobaltochelatase
MGPSLSNETFAPVTKHGLLLVGHGTRDPEGTRQFFELATVLGAIANPLPVQPCLLELQSPTIAEGWAKLAEAGVDHIHVCPLLLFSAGHAKQDIPDAIHQAAANTPTVTYDFARPLSRHDDVIQLAQTRIRGAIEELLTIKSSNSTRTSPVAVLMVGRGSHDPCARTDMFYLSEVVRHAMNRQTSLTLDTGKMRFETCFYAMAEPRLPYSLTQLASDTNIDRIIVYPHLLFEGHLNQAIHRQTAEVAATFPSKKFVVAKYLGPEPEIANAILGRMGF